MLSILIFTHGKNYMEQCLIVGVQQRRHSMLCIDTPVTDERFCNNFIIQYAPDGKKTSHWLL